MLNIYGDVAQLILDKTCFLSKLRSCSVGECIEQRKLLLSSSSRKDQLQLEQLNDAYDGEIDKLQPQIVILLVNNTFMAFALG